MIHIQRIIEGIYLSFRLALKADFWKSQSKSLFGAFFASIGILFSAVQLIDYFFSKWATVRFSTYPALTWVLLGAITVLALILARPRLKMTSRVDGKDVTVALQIGDILLRNGDIVVATNSTFDTSLEGDFISLKSLQGQLATKEYDQLQHLDIEIERQLKGIDFVDVSPRRTKAKQYPIGTVIKLEHRSKRRSYWIALANVNEHGKPDASYDNLYKSLQELWVFLETKGHIVDLYIPVLGSGLTGLDPKRSRIVKDIILSFLKFSNGRKILDSLTICFHPRDVFKHDIKLSELYDYMDYQCRFGSDGRDIRKDSTGIGGK